MDWKIRLYDNGNVICDYDFSEKNLILHNLHLVSVDSESIFLSFTWAALGEGGKMLSRAGFFKIERETMAATAFIQKENGFAGVLEAIPDLSAKNLFDTSKSDEDENSVRSFPIYLVAGEYEENPLYKVEMETANFEIYAVAPVNTNFSNESSESPMKNSPEFSYNPFRYYKNGIFMPLLGVVPIYSHDFSEDATTIFGLTFISTNPWGDRQISFASGWNPIFGNGGLQLGFSGGDDSFQYNLSGTCVFDSDGFMQNCDTLLLSKTLLRGKVSAFSTGVQGSFLYGRQIIDEDSFEDNIDDSVGKSMDGLIFVQFSNIHKISPSVYDAAGFSFKPFVLSSWRETELNPDFDKYLNAGATATFRFPIFIPFIFTGELFPSSKYVASGSVKAIFATIELHKGIPALSLFMQRIEISTTYSGKISYEHGEFWDIKRTDEILKDVKKSDYSDAIQIGADLFLSPNTGFFANDGIQFSLGYAMIYRPNPKSNEKRVAYGLSVGLDL